MAYIHGLIALAIPILAYFLTGRLIVWYDSVYCTDCGRHMLTGAPCKNVKEDDSEGD